MLTNVSPPILSLYARLIPHVSYLLIPISFSFPLFVFVSFFFFLPKRRGAEQYLLISHLGICKLDEGKYWPELLMCLQQNCPAFMAQYQEQFDNLCKPVGPSTTPVYVNTTTTASSSLGGNKTVSSTQQPIKTKTTLLPSKTQSENATTTTIPTQTKPSSSTVAVPTGSAAAAVTLEGVIKWPFAIAVGLAAAL